jgi:hypothetical protein
MEPEEAALLVYRILIIFFALLTFFTLGWYVLEYFTG